MDRADYDGIDINKKYTEFLEEMNDINEMGNWEYDFYVGNCIKEEKELLRKEMKAKKPDKRYVMVTVNVKPNTKVDDLVKKWEKLIGKKWVTDSYSCLEWRELENGLHLHSCLEYAKKAKCEIRRECYNTFKKLVGNKLHVNFQYNTKKDGFVKYIDGWKKMNDGYERKESDKATKLMRLKYGINDVLEGKMFED